MSAVCFTPALDSQPQQLWFDPFMPQTYQQRQMQIAELQLQTEGVKRFKVADVIATARQAVRIYDLKFKDFLG